MFKVYTYSHTLSVHCTYCRGSHKCFDNISRSAYCAVLSVGLLLFELSFFRTHKYSFLVYIHVVYVGFIAKCALWLRQIGKCGANCDS